MSANERLICAAMWPAAEIYVEAVFALTHAYRAYSAALRHHYRQNTTVMRNAVMSVMLNGFLAYPDNPTSVMHSALMLDDLVCEDASIGIAPAVMLMYCDVMLRVEPCSCLDTLRAGERSARLCRECEEHLAVDSTLHRTSDRSSFVASLVQSWLRDFVRYTVHYDNRETFAVASRTRHLLETTVAPPRRDAIPCTFRPLNHTFHQHMAAVAMPLAARWFPEEPPAVYREFFVEVGEWPAAVLARYRAPEPLAVRDYEEADEGQRPPLTPSRLEGDCEACVVCLDSEPNVMLCPCRHVVVCGVCAVRLRRHECPVCRTAVSDALQINRG